MHQVSQSGLENELPGQWREPEAGVPYGRLSFIPAITIFHMRANTNLLCSKQLSLGD